MSTDCCPRERRRIARFGASVLLAAVLLAGCGDGENVDAILGADDERVSTTTLTPSTVPASTVPAAVPTSTVPTTTLTPSTVPASTVPAATVPVATLTPSTVPTSDPAPLPVPLTGFVVVDQRAADGFTLTLEQSYTPFEPYGDLTAQADAIGVDAPGRAAIDAFAANRSAGDFRMVAFRFNTGGTHTDNALVVRYDNPGNDMGPEDLEPVYRSGFETGGSVLSSEIINVNGRPAVVMEGERVVAGEIFNRQFVAVVFGDETVWEVVVTIGLPIDEPMRAIGRQIATSFTLSPTP